MICILLRQKFQLQTLFKLDYTAAKIFMFKMLENELSSELTYHGKHHTEDVLKVTTKLCAYEKISAYETKLVKTACLFHDAGFIISRIEHEKQGCEFAKNYLPRFGYNPDQIKRICSMIMATKVPQNPKNKLEEIICDADLDYLGRDDFFVIGDSLYQELKAQGMIQDKKSWNEMQIKFLERHSFFTSTNIKRRSAKKQAHLEKLKRNNDLKKDGKPNSPPPDLK